MNPKKVCIFIDGENLRHSISHLFTEFDKRTYLPRADWGVFFDWVVEKVLPGSERVRTYWYVVKNVDFSPTNPSKFLNAQKDSFVRAASNDLSFKSKFENANPANQEQLLNEKAVELERRKDEMTRRSKGWDELHEKIEGTFKSVEFRKVGTIRYDLFSKKLGDEKAVDVHLAVDMVTLKDIYDVAIILSGDQDYVPAVKAVKNFGKQVVNIAFQKENGQLLPGGAKRLGQTTDWSVQVTHADLKGFLNL